MKKYTIKKYGKAIAEVSLFIENPVRDKEEFLDSIVKKVPYTKSIGYAGYVGRKNLKELLLTRVFGTKQQEKWLDINEREIVKNIRETVNSCAFVIDKKVSIFVFPTINSFIVKKLKGTAGFVPWKNTILLFVYATKYLNKQVKETLVHELDHAIAFNYDITKAIQDTLIDEGRAERFREYVVGGGRSSWSKSISKRQAKTIFKSIRKKLNSKSPKLYTDLFFGTGKYPHSSGYAIGYYLFEIYLKKQDKIDWRKILKTPPKDIMKDVIAEFI